MHFSSVQAPHVELINLTPLKMNIALMEHPNADK